MGYGVGCGVGCSVGCGVGCGVGSCGVNYFKVSRRGRAIGIGLDIDNGDDDDEGWWMVDVEIRQRVGFRSLTREKNKNSGTKWGNLVESCLDFRVRNFLNE